MNSADSSQERDHDAKRTTERLLGRGNLKQVQHDGLIVTKGAAIGDHREKSVANLAATR